MEAGDHTKTLDFMAPELWEELGWGLAAPEQDRVLQPLLPAVPDASERRRIALDHQRKSLERAKQFYAALDQPASLPDGTSLYLIAGDAAETMKTAAVDRSTGKLEVIGHAAGDGTVLRTSALMDARVGRTWSPNVQSPIDWTHVSFLFSDHLGMTRDPNFTDNLLYLLLEDPREMQPSASRTSGTWPP